jgi:hypothetical protein
MTSQSPRIYIYKITFEEVPYYYYGVHKEKRFDEEYWGSPVTNRWCWELYTPEKQILELFDFWEEAQEVEKRLIKSVYNTDKWCLNKNCGGIISLDILKENGKKVSEKYSRINGIKNGNRVYELGVGMFGRTKEQMTEDGKKGGERVKELGIGVHARTKEQMTEDGKKGGKIVGEMHKKNRTAIFGRSMDQHSLDSKKGGKIAGRINKENGTGICGIPIEQRRETGRKSGLKIKENGTGIFGMSECERKKANEKANETNKINGTGIYSITKEDRIKQISKTNSQKWMCDETAYISTPAGLSKYQKKRGIDTSKRTRIS